MAVATDREYGLFIGGELAEPACVIVSTGRARSTRSGCSRRHVPVGGARRRHGRAGELRGPHRRARRCSRRRCARSSTSRSGRSACCCPRAWIGATSDAAPVGARRRSLRRADRARARSLRRERAFLVGGCACAEASRCSSRCSRWPGPSGSSVNSASGRAVMHWFAPSERGLALGIRQTAIPLGGLIVALVLPGLAESGGSEAAFLFLAGLAALGRDRRARRPCADARDGRARARVGRGDAARRAALAAVGLGAVSTSTRRSRSSGSASSSSTTSTASSDAGRGARHRGVAGARGRAPDRCRPLVGRRRIPDRPAARVRARRRGGAGAHGAPRGGPAVGARPRARARGEPLDGVERSLVHGGGRARRRCAERCGDRLPADGALRHRRARAVVLFAATVSTGRGRSRSQLAALFPLVGWLALRPLRAH